MDDTELRRIEELLNNGYYYDADTSTLGAMRRLLEELKRLHQMLAQRDNRERLQ
jgi:hypothetical protein